MLAAKVIEIVGIKKTFSENNVLLIKKHKKRRGVTPCDVYTSLLRLQTTRHAERSSQCREDAYQHLHNDFPGLFVFHLPAVLEVWSDRKRAPKGSAVKAPQESLLQSPCPRSTCLPPSPGNPRETPPYAACSHRCG